MLEETVLEIDFGSRSVVLESTLDANGANLTLRLGSFTITPSGLLQGTNLIQIVSEGDVEIGGTRSRGAVRMVDEDGGDLRITTQGGSVTGSGRIVLNSNTSDGDGGSLTINANGPVMLIGTIESIGGIEGGGGTVTVHATNTVSITGDIDLTGGGLRRRGSRYRN